MKKSFYIFFIIVVFILAIFLRFYHLGTNGYWVDENLVVTQIAGSLHQVIISDGSSYTPTPKFFLIILKIISLCFNKDEWVLRFLPCLFGSLSVVLFFLFSKKITKDNYFVSSIATILFAFNLRMLQYSQTLKTYTGEIFFVILLFYLTEIYLSNGYSSKYFIILFLTSIFGLFLFFPIVFILPAIVLRILYDFLRRSKWFNNNTLNIKLSWILYSLTIFLGFLVNYLFLTVKAGELLLKYWDKNFLDPGNLGISILSGLFNFFTYLFPSSFYHFSNLLIIPIIFCLLFLVGMIYLIFQKGYSQIIYFFIPVILVILAALFQKYPFGGVRVNLFLMPFIFIFIGYGSYFLFSFIKFEWVKIIIISLIFIFSLILALSYNDLSYDNHNEDINQVIHWYGNLKQPGDYVYVSNPTLSYFTMFYPINENTIFTKGADNKTKDWDLEVKRIVSVVGNKRLWLISRYLAYMEEPEVLDGLRKECTLLDYKIEKNSVGYLFSC